MEQHVIISFLDTFLWGAIGFTFVCGLFRAVKAKDREDWLWGLFLMGAAIFTVISIILINKFDLL